MKAARNRRVPLAVLTVAVFLGAAPGLTAPILPPDLVEHVGELAAKNALELILADLAGQRDALIRIQRELVRLPGVNPEDGGEGEEAKARWIEDWLAAEGLPPPERVDCPDGRVPAKIRPNLILRYPNPPLDRPTLWVVAYLDNAPAGDVLTWTGSPFSLRVDGDLMYGLGVQDNNDAIAAALLLQRSLNRYKSVAPFNFAALFVSAEKVGSAQGFFHVMSKRPGLFGKSDRFLVLSYGTDGGKVIEVAEKGVAFYNIGVRGKQAHSGTSTKGKNALAAGAEFIARLPRLSAVFPASNPLFELPVSSFTPTRPVAPETSRNQVPGDFSFYIDARFLHGYSAEAVRKELEGLAEEVEAQFGVTVRVAQDHPDFPSSPIVPADAPEVISLKRAVAEQLAVETRLVGIGGHSLAGDLRQMGFNALVWRIATFQEHSADESMSIKANLDQAAVIARMLFDTELAASPPPDRQGGDESAGRDG